MELPPSRPLRVAIPLVAILLALQSPPVLAAAVRDGLERAPVVRILAHPEQEGVIIAGIEGRGAVASWDGGSSWEPLVDGLEDLEVRDLALEPSGSLVAASGTRVYRLDGESGLWIRTGPQDLPSEVTSLAAVPARPGVLYAGTARHAVWRSEDGGASWRRIFNGVALRAVSSLVVTPGEPDTLHVVGTSTSTCTLGLPGEKPGVYTTRDGGAEWYVSSQYVEDRHFYTAAFIGESLYYSTTEGLALSWRRKVFERWGLSERVVTELIEDPFLPDRLLAAADGLWEGRAYRLERFRDPVWREIGRGLPERQSVTALAADPHRPGAFYAGTEFGALYRSFDGGETWHEVRPPVAELP